MNEYEIQTTIGSIIIQAVSANDAYNIASDRLAQSEQIASITLVKRGIVSYDVTSGMCQT